MTPEINRITVTRVKSKLKSGVKSSDYIRVSHNKSMGNSGQKSRNNNNSSNSVMSGVSSWFSSGPLFNDDEPFQESVKPTTVKDASIEVNLRAQRSQVKLGE